jgi:two-component system chemotaxis response regulator CheB
VPAEALVVVGASAGGMEGLRSLVAGLPADLPAAVLIVLHLPRTGPSALPRILDRAGPMEARHAVDGESLRAGRVYVAPPGQHLLVSDGHVLLTNGPAENGHRPAVDPLFRSAARSYGPRTVAVVLSGSRDDGTAGAVVVAEAGGAVLVEDPGGALHPSMPRSVVDHVPTAKVCSVAELGTVAASAVRAVAGAPFSNAVPDRSLVLETAMAEFQDLTSADLPGRPAAFACPSCHGGLFELPGEPAPRYRCWVGHAWSPQSLLDEQAAAFEGALWMALRSLEENAALAHRMQNDAQRRGLGGAAARYATVGQDAEEAGSLIKELIRRIDNPAGEAAP